MSLNAEGETKAEEEEEEEEEMGRWWDRIWSERVK
jgi:hypothetical protein